MRAARRSDRGFPPAPHQRNVLCLRMMDRTTDSASRQLAALHADIWEVGCFDPRDPREPMRTRTWDTDSLLRSVPWLKHENATGRNIYVRPHGEHGITLIDDVNETAIQRMKRDGFAPAAVIETSPGNFQSWLHHGTTLSPAEGTQAAKDLAKRYNGDLKSADWRHFGRLAGFTNQKRLDDGSLKYADGSGRAPFCRLTESTGTQYWASDWFIRDLQMRVSIMERQARQQRERNASRLPQNRELLGIEFFHRNERDGSRADRSYAVYARSHGLPETEIAAAIIQYRDLSHHREGPVKYAERTIRGAEKYLGMGL
jgi:hypothetical protein